jgi:hypothetical protein
MTPLGASRRGRNLQTEMMPHTPGEITVTIASRIHDILGISIRAGVIIVLSQVRDSSRGFS